jgi:hypothetical protein
MTSIIDMIVGDCEVESIEFEGEAGLVSFRHLSHF